MNLNIQMQKSLVVGAGITGLSCLRYLNGKGVTTSIYDDVLSEAKREKIKSISLNTSLFDKENEIDDILSEVSTLVLSPGISLKHPLVSKAREKQLELIGDIELFAKENTKPVLAVTGSNAKSTVVTLLHLMAKHDGKRVALAGNIGTPVLDMLNDKDLELYVLELSSFQLDITYSLNTLVSCILNISPDHLDRYESFEEYAKSKQSIYKHAQYAVFNRDDSLTTPDASFSSRLISFGMDEPDENNYGLLEIESETYLAFGSETIMPISELPKQGSIDVQNALAALTIARLAGIGDEAIKTVLKEFKGLAHRCELVEQRNGITWINDSKGTNVGATQAALHGFATSPVILIAGGDSKGGDIDLLMDEVSAHVSHMFLLGKDARLFHERFKDVCSCEIVSNLEEAVNKCLNVAKEGDVVLLSPACSSLDMFSSYQERGNIFKEKVHLALGGINEANA